ncbi:hypothetical protein HUA78_34365 [Myxococcus sp. CA033]|uniref:SitI6 family double-CXXCG motif immunity protein n=1 Tax=Myxococcus sp. CA033 TaxID=2741516 RepID=UPI00157ABE85|nr:double-CXXCG motif protein [Myxococcus sp. CA033]NTX39533.1 hypothetical protein [Myxococcus sp. CA033]
MRVYELRTPARRRWSAALRATRKWSLPGVEDCPGCRETWSGTLAYPAVDLSGVDWARRLEEPRPAQWGEVVELRELVRPLCPPGALLEPGTEFGPAMGTALGRWGPVTLTDPWTVWVRTDALEYLSGLRGITPARHELRRTVTELLELQIPARGRLAPECLPATVEAPCGVCGRAGWRLPQRYWLDSAQVPDLDLWRLEDAPTVVCASERFAHALDAMEDPSDILLVELAAEDSAGYSERPPRPAS